MKEPIRCASCGGVSDSLKTRACDYCGSPLFEIIKDPDVAKQRRPYRLDSGATAYRPTGEVAKSQEEYWREKNEQ